LTKRIATPRHFAENAHCEPIGMYAIMQLYSDREREAEKTFLDLKGSDNMVTYDSMTARIFRTETGERWDSSALRQGSFFDTFNERIMSGRK
jgi:hypothetical protein